MKSKSPEPRENEPERLRKAEERIARMEGEAGPAIRERVAALEELRKHLATKAWVLGGVLSGMGVAAGIGVGLATLIQRASGKG